MNTPLIVKVGGAFIDSKDAAAALFDSLQTVLRDRPVIMVHGGGPLVEDLIQRLGLKTNKIQGLRVTPDEQMPYICGALAGAANKQLCASAKACRLNVVGLSLLDGDLVTCEALPEQFGAVGTPQANNPALLTQLLGQGYVPIISSIGCDGNGRLLNINADQAATVIAQLTGGDLYLLSDVEGVLDQNKQRYGSLTAEQIESAVKAGIITEGMQVKVDAALLAANTLSRPITIGSWRASLTALAEHQTGTQIYPANKLSGSHS